MSINIGDGVIKILGDTTPVDRKIAGIGQKAKTAGTQAARGLKPMNTALSGIAKMAATVGAAFLAWKAVSIFKNMIKAASNFQREMNRVRALTGAVGKQFDQLSEQAKELGRTTQFSASQAAAGMAFLAQAGFSANEIVKAMPDTLNLAAAAQIDLAQAADIVSNVMSGMGIAVENLGQTVDILTKSFTSANTDLRQLGQAMKFAGPVASDFGLSIAETAGALSLLGNAGIQASMAGTSLRNILNRLVRDGEKFGINIFDSTGKMKSFAQIIEAVDQAALSATDRIKLFGDRAGPSMSVFLRQGSKAIEEYIESLDDFGIASKIAKIQMEGLAGSVKRLESAWEGLQIQIAEVGLIDAVTGTIDVLTELIAVMGPATESIEDFKRARAELEKFEEKESALQRLADRFHATPQAAEAARAAILDFVDGAAALSKVMDELIDKKFKEEIKATEQALAAAAQAAALAARERAKEHAAVLVGLEESFGAPFIKMRREAEKAAEELEKERIKRSLADLNEEINKIVPSLELATEGIGAFMEPTEEQLEAMRKKLADTGISFTELGQQAVDAFNQIAGSVRGSGGVVLRVMGLIIGQIFRNIAANQAIAASTVATEAAKKGATIKAIKDIALVKAIFETGMGFAALGRLDFFAAAKHFAAAGFFGAVGALQIAAVAGAFGGGRGGGGAPGAGAEGAAPIRGQVAGDTSGGGTLEVERRLQEGGIITRPTLALLGEQAPRIPEAVIPLRRNRAGGIELDEGGGAVTNNFFIEGLVSSDNILEFIEKINELTKHSNVELQASDSFNVTQKT